MIQPRIRQNPFETYEEVAEGFEDLLAPLELFFDREYQGHLDLGTHGTVYSKGTRDAEAFLRPLWGLGSIKYISFVKQRKNVGPINKRTAKQFTQLADTSQ